MITRAATKTMRESFRFRHDDCVCKQELLSSNIDENLHTHSAIKCGRLHIKVNYFYIVLIMILTTCTARPHNTTTVDSSPHKLIHSGAKNDSNHSQERTRILTFPRRPTSTNAHDENDYYQPDIVFPDSLESFSSGHVSFEPMTRIDVTPECAANGGTFCEDIPAYPYKLLRDVLSRSKSAAADSVLFGADETPDEFAQRIGEPEENYICGAIDKTVFPKAGKNKNNKWKYIINQGSKDGYVQGVRVELCTSTGKPCDLFGHQPNGYVTSCKQKFIYRKMMSLSDGGQPLPDTFLMPSACCCSYKRDNRFLARIGEAPVTPA